MSPLSLLRSIVNSPSVSNLLITRALQSRHILVNIFCSHSRLITSFLWYGDQTVRNTVSSAWPTFCTTVTWCPNSLLTQTMNASKPYAFFTTHLPALLLSGKRTCVPRCLFYDTPRTLPFTLYVLLWFIFQKCITSNWSELNSFCHSLIHFPNWSISRYNRYREPL